MGLVRSGMLEVVRDEMNMRLCACRRPHSKVWSCVLRPAGVGWFDTSEEMKYSIPFVLQDDPNKIHASLTCAPR